jgi:ferrochelatase
MSEAYEALVVVGFGGPENRDDVIPFLENVTRGRNVPRERLLEVAEHYYHFGGRSPINDQNRALVAALEEAFRQRGPQLRVYWGNRNWPPYLTDTVQQMNLDGIERALAFATSAFGSYSGCRQYQEDIDGARAVVPGSLEIDKLPPFHNHPLFISAVADQVQTALEKLPDARIIFTAHSIPVSLAASSPYERQLREASELVARRLGRSDYTLAYQSRSGPAAQPWLEPEILETLRSTARDGVKKVVVVPIGFLSDHLEVLYDLDTEAAAVAHELGIEMIRAATVGTHPDLVEMIRLMVKERVDDPEIVARTQCDPGCCQPRRRG